MITHYKPINAELEKEQAELDMYLGQHSTVGIIQKKIHGKSNPWKMEYKTDLIKSRKYTACTMSATQIAERFLDDESII